jgi:hypothetical protein
VVIAWRDQGSKEGVKQLSVEMFQQCSHASSYMQTYVMEEHSMLFVLNGPVQVF